MNATTALNQLIEICKDGKNGFHDAGENAKHADLKNLFTRYSLQRAKFAGDLDQLVTQLGAVPEKTGSVASIFHRGWIALKSAITNGSDHAILAECERGEAYAVSAYHTALEAELPTHIRAIITAQSGEVQATHDDICNRRAAAAAYSK